MFKARMIVRGFEMETGVDFMDNFSPTPCLPVARLMMFYSNRKRHGIAQGRY
jgi:hypothetical protein